MIYSLNEIDVHCKKAARGAGFDWGYAEDIGKAVRWLAAFDLPSTALLAGYLKEFDQHAADFGQPDTSDELSLNAVNATSLCPILTGAWLCDSACIKKNSQIKINNLRFPLLLMPFLSQVARSIQQTLTFDYQYGQLQYSNGILNFHADVNTICTLAETTIVIMDNRSIEGKTAAIVGQNTAAQDWTYLNSHASKTYVPATEASRLGAGPAE